MYQITRMMKMILPVLGLFLSVGAAAQQQITLKEALNYAVQNNTNAKKARLDIEKGRARTAEVRAQALPQITGNTGLTYNPVIGSIVFGDQAIRLGQTWNSQIGAQLEQQIFNQQVFTGLQAAKASESYYQLNASLTEEQVIEQVANNYYQVLVNREQLSVIDTNIKNVKVVERIINTQYKSGLAKKIDVDRIRVNLTNLETQRSQTINAITQLENQLKFAMGMPVSAQISLPRTELSQIQQLPEPADSINVDNRTEMQLMNTQRNLLTLQRKAYVAEYFPTLSLSGNYTYAAQSNRFDYLGTNPVAIAFGSSAIGVTLRVPIFNGFATRSRIRQADVDIRKIDNDIYDTKNGLNLAYENAKLELRNSFNTINSQRQNVALAEEIYRSTQNNYNNGLAALTDLLDTENALTQAQNSYTQALLNYKIAEIQLIKSNGNIKSLLK
ncbi:transporter [Pedobacter yulinensis]|uniref:Transporter n=1 Tax=Pedobacter yulinensis TaxID=2126353 RepID=A0A2T3HPL2_9SPHI|nr:TolC family protein [Pedobacter yulinensis]PST84382.1 transporter [Pedobacter yulinensis]